MRWRRKCLQEVKCLDSVQLVAILACVVGNSIVHASSNCMPSFAYGIGGLCLRACSIDFVVEVDTQLWLGYIVF